MATLLFALTVWGCGGGGSSTGAEGKAAKKGGTLRVGLISEPTTLQPSEATDGASIDVIEQVVEPLYEAGQGGTIKPNLVESTKMNDDDTKWTIELRQGVEFSTGQPMTAADVVFSIDAARDSEAYSELYKPIEKVVATSPTTVVIETKTPMPALLADLSFYVAGIVPKDYDGMSEKEFADGPIGTGGFQVKAWDHGQSITLTPNTHYWKQGRPYLEKVVYTTIPDENSRVSQLRGGDLDVIPAPPFSQIEGLEDVPGMAIAESDGSRTDSVIFNVKKGLFADPRARQAFDLAINRDAVVKAALNGHGSPAGSFLPSSILYSDPGVEAAQQDLAKAKDLLAEAVADSGESASVTLLTTAGEAYGSLASQVMQQDLQSAGFEVRLQPLDEAALNSAIEEGGFDAILTWYAPAILDPSELTYFLSFYMELAGSDQTHYNELATRADRESDAGKREALYHQIQQLVAEERILLPIDYEPFVWGLREDISGFELSPGLGNPDYAEVGFSD